MSFIVDFERKANDKLYGTKTPIISQVHSNSFSSVCVLTARSILRNAPTKRRLQQPDIHLVSEEAPDFGVKFSRVRPFVETSGNCVLLFSVSSTIRRRRRKSSFLAQRGCIFSGSQLIHIIASFY